MFWRLAEKTGFRRNLKHSIKVLLIDSFCYDMNLKVCGKSEERRVVSFCFNNIWNVFDTKRSEKNMS